MEKQQTTKSYATFGLSRSMRQLSYAWKSRAKAEQNMSSLLELVRRDEQRMEKCYGRPLEKMRILEIGPGQGMERARYFGVKNTVIGLDLDVIPQGLEVGKYLQMIRENGFGRFAKTVGRKLVLGPVNSKAWEKAVGVKNMRYPAFLHGDICQSIPEANAFDMVMSWSVFEHLPDPRAGLKNVIATLKPGGMFFISLHLFTSNNGHHDIRAFTGREDELPLWAHLRPSTKDQIDPSSYLNEWRLAQWRELFTELAPGHAEYLESYDYPERYGAKLTGPLLQELSQYTKQELLTVDMLYAWKKPLA